jgi:hypothetical protein
MKKRQTASHATTAGWHGKLLLLLLLVVLLLLVLLLSKSCNAGRQHLFCCLVVTFEPQSGYSGRVVVVIVLCFLIARMFTLNAVSLLERAVPPVASSASLNTVGT